MEAVQQLAPYQQKEFMKEMTNLQLKDSLTYVFCFVCRCHDVLSINSINQSIVETAVLFLTIFFFKFRRNVLSYMFHQHVQYPGLPLL